MKNIHKDMEIATRFLFLGMAKKIIQQDIKNIKSGSFKIKDPYINLLEKMHSIATQESKNVRQIMWDKKISIIELGRRVGFTDYKLIANRKEIDTAYNNLVIKKHVKDILEELMQKSLEGS